MGRKRVSVIDETETDRNIRFHDNYNQNDMTRNQFVNQIRQGNYDNYHIRNINGIDTPCSNPDETKNNNLG